MKKINLNFFNQMLKIKYEIFLFILIFLLFILTPLKDFGGDTLPSKYVVLSIINEKNFNLNEYYDFLVEEYPYDLDKESTPYYLVKTEKGYVSTFGIGVPLLYSPFVYVANFFLNLEPRNWFKISLIFKAVSAFFLVLSSIFIYLILISITDKSKATILTLAFALCTNVWTISSQGPWQHGASQLLLSITLFLLFKGLKHKYLIKYSSIPLAFAVLVRPTNIVAVFVISIYVFFIYKKEFLKFVVLSLPFVLILFTYNFIYFDNFFSNAQLIASKNVAFIKTGTENVWSGNIVVGLLGNLFSPSRGIFIFSPFLLFLFIPSKKFFKNNNLIVYLIMSCLGFLILASAWFDWWGGYSFGNRTLLETIPFLIILLAYKINNFWKIKMLRVFFIILILISFLIQIMGVHYWDNSWNVENDVDKNQQVLWSLKNNQINFYFNKIFIKNNAGIIEET